MEHNDLDVLNSRHPIKSQSRLGSWFFYGSDPPRLDFPGGVPEDVRAIMTGVAVYPNFRYYDSEEAAILDLYRAWRIARPGVFLEIEEAAKKESRDEYTLGTPTP